MKQAAMMIKTPEGLTIAGDPALAGALTESDLYKQLVATCAELEKTQAELKRVQDELDLMLEMRAQENAVKLAAAQERYTKRPGLLHRIAETVAAAIIGTQMAASLVIGAGSYEEP